MRDIRFLIIGFILISTTVIQSQVGVPFNQRDDEYPLLGLKRAKEAYEFALAEYERKLKMFEKELISRQELERSKNTLADA